MKKVLVIGASPQPWRYAYKAVRMLQDYDYKVLALGKTSERIENVYIETKRKAWENIHTITLYLNSQNSSEMQDYILSLEPQRLIINPGAENPQLEDAAQRKGIEVVRACTLVLLSTGQFEASSVVNN